MTTDARCSAAVDGAVLEIAVSVVSLMVHTSFVGSNGKLFTALLKTCSNTISPHAVWNRQIWHIGPRPHQCGETGVLVGAPRVQDNFPGRYTSLVLFWFIDHWG